VQRGEQAIQEADILAIHIEIDKGANGPRLVIQAAANPWIEGIQPL
jgi:hypothetical protein